LISQPDLDQIIKKTRQYEFSDGLRDLQLAVFVGFGGVAAWLSFEPFWLTIIGKTVNTFGRWAGWIGMLPIVLLIAAVWGMLWLMEQFRRRWLWRETGMVKASKWIVSRRVNLISFFIILTGIGMGLGFQYLGLVKSPFVLRMIWTATGWSLGYTLAGMGQEIGLPRYIKVGAIGGLLSTILLFLPLSFGQSSLGFGSIWFTLLLTSGMITLRSSISNMKKADNGG
jgi:hypothetical protein